MKTLLKGHLGNLTAKPVRQRATQQLRSHVAIQEGRLDNALRMEYSKYRAGVPGTNKDPI